MAGRILALGLVFSAAVTAAEPRWEASVFPAWATTGHLSGPAAGVQVLRRLNGWFAAGISLDSARLSAAGMAYAMGFDLRPEPYSYAVATTFGGAMAQFRLGLGWLEPYADLSAGWVVVRELYSHN